MILNKKYASRDTAHVAAAELQVLISWTQDLSCSIFVLTAAVQEKFKSSSHGKSSHVSAIYLWLLIFFTTIPTAVAQVIWQMTTLLQHNDPPLHSSGFDPRWNSHKLTFSVGDLDPPSNIRFLGPTTLAPNGILIGSVVFAQLTSREHLHITITTMTSVINKSYKLASRMRCTLAEVRRCRDASQ